MPYNEKIIEYFKNVDKDEYSKAVDESKELARAQGIYILDAHLLCIYAHNVDFTEKCWLKFNEQPKHMRRKADWITLQYFGVTNQDIYDTAMSLALGENDDSIPLTAEFDGHAYIEESTNPITELVQSTLNKDFKAKEKINLSSLKKIHITETIIDKYKKDYPVLRHVRCKDTKEYKCDGYMWFDDEELVCYVGSCEYFDDHTKWIVSLEVTPKYKGHGLSTQILDFATKSMKSKYLSVNKNNKLAKYIYDKYGFKTYTEDESMYYMTLETNPLKESASEPEQFVANSDKVNVYQAIEGSKTDTEIHMNSLELMKWVQSTGIICMKVVWKPNVSYIVPFPEPTYNNGVTFGGSLENIQNNLRQLEQRWAAFNMMPLKKRRESDWKLLELFNVTNLQYYLYEKNELIKQMNGRRFEARSESANIDIAERLPSRSKFYLIKHFMENMIQSESCSPNDVAESLINIDLDSTGVYDDMVIPNVISDVIGQYDGLTQNIVELIDTGISDLPAYTPDEMLDMGVFGTAESNMYGVECGFEDAKEWFEEFCAFYQTGIYSESLNEKSLKRIHKLEELSRIFNRDEVVKQQMLEYGWNPEVQFTPKNRAIADAAFKMKVNKVFSELSTVINVSTDKEDIKMYDGVKAELKPIYIVLEQGMTPGFSSAIKKITDSIYSHAMISFDSSMEKLYSFGVNESKSILGGFIIENLYKKPKDALIKIYAIFVKEDTFEMIKNKVNWFIENQNKTHYSWKNIFKFLFNRPSTDKDSAMICSQFVDRLFKLVNIDFTKAPSSLVAPATLDRMAKKNKHIYTCFADKIAKFKQTKLDRTVDRLITKVKPIKESNIRYTDTEFAYQTIKALDENDNETLIGLSAYLEDQNDNMKSIYNHIIMPCLEAREIPIEIKKNGDVIIRLLAPGDFEAAFSKSNKLLREYKKSNNTEGMKNEIAYLWYLNMLIEKKLHTSAVLESRRKELVSARAHILGSFKEYFAEVQKTEPGFNFSEYFDNSKYSDSVYRISGTTISSIASMIKNII